MQTRLFMQNKPDYRAKHLSGAYRKGYSDALRDRDACPYTTNYGGFAQAWENGWLDGFKEGEEIGLHKDI